MTSQIQEFLARGLGQHTVYDFVLAFFIFLLIFVGFHLFKTVVIHRLKKLAERTKTTIDDQLIHILDNIPQYFYYVVALYFPLKLLISNESVLKFINAVFIIVLVYQAVKVLQSLIAYALSGVVTKNGDRKSTTFHGVKLLVNFILWSVAVLLVLSNLGFDITSLVASLGIGGIAIALAVQNVLGDIFASFSIYFDRPFEIGDYIVVGDHDGNVEKIGLKTTRLRTLHGEELVISNNELTNSRISNYKKMSTRREVITLGLEYSTSNAKIKKAKEIMIEAVKSVKDVEFERCFFNNFGVHSLDIELVYYVLSDDMFFALERKEEINLYIKAAFEKAKIEMAFPTQTVYLEK